MKVRSRRRKLTCMAKKLSKEGGNERLQGNSRARLASARGIQIRFDLTLPALQHEAPTHTPPRLIPRPPPSLDWLRTPPNFHFRFCPCHLGACLRRLPRLAFVTARRSSSSQNLYLSLPKSRHYLYTSDNRTRYYPLPHHVIHLTMVWLRELA